MMELTQELRQELTQEQQQRILAILSTYQELKTDADLLKDAVAAEVAKVYEILKEAGVDKTEINGIKLTEVGGESSSFDKKLFVLNGGDIDVYNKSFRKKPKKKYLKITIGDEKEDSSDE